MVYPIVQTTCAEQLADLAGCLAGRAVAVAGSRRAMSPRELNPGQAAFTV